MKKNDTTKPSKRKVSSVNARENSDKTDKSKNTVTKTITNEEIEKFYSNVSVRGSSLLTAELGVFAKIDISPSSIVGYYVGREVTREILKKFDDNYATENSITNLTISPLAPYDDPSIKNLFKSNPYCLLGFTNDPRGMAFCTKSGMERLKTNFCNVKFSSSSARLVVPKSVLTENQVETYKKENEKSLVYAIAIEAINFIETGEELLLSYGANYWKDVEKEKNFNVIDRSKELAYSDGKVQSEKPAFRFYENVILSTQPTGEAFETIKIMKRANTKKQDLMDFITNSIRTEIEFSLDNIIPFQSEKNSMYMKNFRVLDELIFTIFSTLLELMESKPFDRQKTFDELKLKNGQKTFDDLTRELIELFSTNWFNDETRAENLNIHSDEDIRIHASALFFDISIIYKALPKQLKYKKFQLVKKDLRILKKDNNSFDIYFISWIWHVYLETDVFNEALQSQSFKNSFSKFTDSVEKLFTVSNDDFGTDIFGQWQPFIDFVGQCANILTDFKKIVNSTNSMKSTRYGGTGRNAANINNNIVSTTTNKNNDTVNESNEI